MLKKKKNVQKKYRQPKNEHFINAIAIIITITIIVFIRDDIDELENFYENRTIIFEIVTPR